jgi:hypothetical protein
MPTGKFRTRDPNLVSKTEEEEEKKKKKNKKGKVKLTVSHCD